MRFDRVLFSGALFAHAFLVGQRKQHKAGLELFLSDHFAVLAVLDVHESHAVRGGSGALLQSRRAALGRARDQAALLERQGNRASLEAGREAARLEKARAQAAERASFEDRARATARQRTAELARLREAAFGLANLFRISVPEALPVPLADVSVPVLDGLPAGSAAASWRHLVAEEGAVALPAVAGLVNKHNTCYALSLLQVLLRLPPLALWLQWHYSRCDANLSCDVNLSPVSCLLPLQSGFSKHAARSFEGPTWPTSY